MQIANRHAVSFHYTLTDDQGTVIDSSEGREPLAYIHGEGHIVVGLEKALEGHSVGDAFKVDVKPEEGYGIRHDEMVQVVPREAFPGVEDLQPGMQFQGRNDQGSINVTVTSVVGNEVTIDANHPLAGQTLHFDVKITGVREATEEELQHGHVHGEGGHHH
ncbi:FKBP-type peptidyl-prolyl cis-trans isomerase SlyD [Luteibacter sp. Sphag1AF]|uniref:FKBP-type peptidyl-prolyl cis-trans isomerase n=1 Tax=Luteibacter sp. Sphag1AF TaxID=2587031 RepID=UPI00161B1E35|nr:peptidylprolyl isomerase [Luteibacter sp. Sphag1AF]MBB3227156.1 FKBP-type peptidyl-prolyl cis-trans isomerase SlyD [Luteibacter sp. Sphag1AF]